MKKKISKKKTLDSRAIVNFRTLRPKNKAKAIFVMGCGGTGGYVVGPLARMVKAYAQKTSELQPAIILADGDAVEEKNLSRQHFIKRDLGRNKAEVMAARYGSALGMDIAHVPSYVESPSVLSDFIHEQRPQYGLVVIIGCVDNNASRRVMHEWMMSSTGEAFWIDAGNETDSGQVICGFVPKLYNSYGSVEEYFSLPIATEVYPELLEGDMKFNSQLSCAELAQSAPQNMMANFTAATIILNFIQKILYREPLASHGAVFSIDNVFRTILNTEEALAKVSERRKRHWERLRRTV